MIKYEDVHKAIYDCLAGSEDNPNLIVVEGTIRQFGLDSVKLQTYRDQVIGWLKQLDTSFFASVGGGMSLMNMVVDKHGSLWGEQSGADELFVLASGLGLAKFTMPREMWNVLPGSMPYITVDDNAFVIKASEVNP